MDSGNAAEVSTALATWWLVYTTIIAALTTLAAVAAAFIVPTWRASRERAEHRCNQKTLRGVTKGYLQRVFQDFDAFGRCYVPDMKETQERFWTYLNHMEIDIALINHCLAFDVGDERYPLNLLILRQSLYETRDACKALLPGGYLHDKYSEWVGAQGIVDRAKERCKEARAYLS